MPKILVIDDEKAVVELIKAKLERNGFEVLSAFDGVEGLQAVSKVKPDLIVLDILMPRMDGFQFFKKIKEKEAWRDIPFLVMTARGAMKDSFEGLGVQSFLTKPFDPDELVNQVKELLTHSSHRPIKTIKKALIAGSDAVRLKMMGSQLEQKGYQVELATDGPKALAKALQLLPDLFVVQFDMPEMSADEIIEILNNYPGSQKVSVVVYSPLAAKETIAHSQWGRFLDTSQKKEIRDKEAPLKVIDKFDTNSFLDKIKDFL